MTSSKSLMGILAILGLITPACTSMQERSANFKSDSSKSSSRAPASATDNRQRRERRQNALLLKLRADATPEQKAALEFLYKDLDLRHDKHILNKRAARVKINKAAYLDQEEHVASLIRATGAVEYAEPDYVAPMALVPNDPSYGNQWFHAKIGSEQAWNYTTGNSNTQVAVCDSGFELTHPDLAPRFVLPGYNTVKDSSQIDAINAHGTMTAGVVGAAGNNGIGVAGTAWNIRILPIQISDRADGASTYSDIAECITYAGNRGAKVVNVSYDYTYASSTVNDAAAALRAVGGLVVVAAGNAATDISYWGSSPNLVVVGATDSNDVITNFSNYGTPVDVVAPGLSIYTTVVGSTYQYASGTSFSSPIVAGLAAEIYSLNPNFTPSQVEQFLFSTTTDLGAQSYDLTYAGGRVSASSAVQAAAATVNVTPPAPIVLDNLAANVSDAYRSFVGKWCDSTQSSFYGTPAVLSCGTGVDTYRFTPAIPSARNYNIYVRFFAKANRNKKMPVTVKSASGTTTKQVSLQSGNGTWVLLGAYSLSAGQANYVELSDGGGPISVDGVRFDPL